MSLIPDDFGEDKAYKNPMVKLFGKDPEGRKCKECKHLIPREYHGKKYFKCALRIETRGPGSDHRANWQACKKFDSNKEEILS